MNIICEYSLNVPAKSSANIPMEGSRNVLYKCSLNFPVEGSLNILFKRSTRTFREHCFGTLKKPEIFFALGTFMELSGKVLCYRST